MRRKKLKRHPGKGSFRKYHGEKRKNTNVRGLSNVACTG